MLFDMLFKSYEKRNSKCTVTYSKPMKNENKEALILTRNFLLSVFNATLVYQLNITQQENKIETIMKT